MGRPDGQGKEQSRQDYGGRRERERERLWAMWRQRWRACYSRAAELSPFWHYD